MSLQSLPFHETFQATGLLDSVTQPPIPQREEWDRDFVFKRCQSASDAIAGSQTESAKKVMNTGDMLLF